MSKSIILITGINKTIIHSLLLCTFLCFFCSTSPAQPDDEWTYVNIEHEDLVVTTDDVHAMFPDKSGNDVTIPKGTAILRIPGSFFLGEIDTKVKPRYYGLVIDELNPDIHNRIVELDVPNPNLAPFATPGDMNALVHYRALKYLFSQSKITLPNNIVLPLEIQKDPKSNIYFGKLGLSEQLKEKYLNLLSQNPFCVATTVEKPEQERSLAITQVEDLYQKALELNVNNFNKKFFDEFKKHFCKTGDEAKLLNRFIYALGGGATVDDTDKKILDQLKSSISDSEKEIIMATMLGHAEGGQAPVVFPRNKDGKYTFEQNSDGKSKRIPHPDAEKIQLAHLKLVNWSFRNRARPEYDYRFRRGSPYFSSENSNEAIRALATKEAAYSALNSGNTGHHYRSLCMPDKGEENAHSLALRAAIEVHSRPITADPTFGMTHYFSPIGIPGFQLGTTEKTKLYSTEIDKNKETLPPYDPMWDPKKPQDIEHYKELYRFIQMDPQHPTEFGLPDKDDQWTQTLLLPPIVIDGVWIDLRWFTGFEILKAGNPKYNKQNQGYDILANKKDNK